MILTGEPGDLKLQPGRPVCNVMPDKTKIAAESTAERTALWRALHVEVDAGLDTFAQRKTDIAGRMHIFEVDQPYPQEWKRQWLIAPGYGIPEWLHLVPVDFEAGGSTWKALSAAGFDAKQPAIIASTGVSMYLTKEATQATFRQVAALASGSTLAMTFMLPPDLMPPDVRPGVEQAVKGAQASGTPFISFFTPAEMMTMARDAGLHQTGNIGATKCNLSNGLIECLAPYSELDHRRLQS